MSDVSSTHHSRDGRENGRRQTTMQPNRGAGQENAAGQPWSTHADRPNKAVTRLERLGGSMQRPGERSTAVAIQVFSTRHSDTRGNNNSRQAALQPDQGIGPDGADALNGDQLGTIGM